jgi:hypothetical protein
MRAFSGLRAVVVRDNEGVFSFRFEDPHVEKEACAWGWSHEMLELVLTKYPTNRREPTCSR